MKRRYDSKNEEAKRQKKESEARIMVCGEGGVGKSHLSNSILGSTPGFEVTSSGVSHRHVTCVPVFIRKGAEEKHRIVKYEDLKEWDHDWATLYDLPYTEHMLEDLPEKVVDYDYKCFILVTSPHVVLPEGAVWLDTPSDDLMMKNEYYQVIVGQATVVVAVTYRTIDPIVLQSILSPRFDKAPPVLINLMVNVEGKMYDHSYLREHITHDASTPPELCLPQMKHLYLELLKEQSYTFAFKTIRNDGGESAKHNLTSNGLLEILQIPRSPFKGYGQIMREDYVKATRERVISYLNDKIETITDKLVYALSKKNRSHGITFNYCLDDRQVKRDLLNEVKYDLGSISMMLTRANNQTFWNDIDGLQPQLDITILKENLTNLTEVRYKDMDCIMSDYRFMKGDERSQFINEYLSKWKKMVNEIVAKTYQ